MSHETPAERELFEQWCERTGRDPGATKSAVEWHFDGRKECLVLSEDAMKLAAAIHYPRCWDTAAYPTLASALLESVADSFICTNDDTHADGVSPSSPEVKR